MVSHLQQKIIDRIIEVEGGYTNNPNDSGGPTRFGITEAVAREHGYTGSMKDLPRQVAFDIFSHAYWAAVKADDLLKLSEAITAEVVDTGINCGVGVAQEFLQRALNVFNNRAQRYDDIIVDGHIGARTLHALDAYLQQREGTVLITALNCLQGARYIELAECWEKNEAFVYGWMKARVLN